MDLNKGDVILISPSSKTYGTVGGLKDLPQKISCKAFICVVASADSGPEMPVRQKTSTLVVYQSLVSAACLLHFFHGSGDLSMALCPSPCSARLGGRLLSSQKSSKGS